MERDCSASIATLVWAPRPQARTQAQTGLTEMLLHPLSLLPTCNVEQSRQRYAADGTLPMAHVAKRSRTPKSAACWASHTGEDRHSCRENRPGGDWRKRQLLRQVFAAQGPAQPCAEEATRPPCKQRAPEHAHTGRCAASPLLPGWGTPGHPKRTGVTALGGLQPWQLLSGSLTVMVLEESLEREAAAAGPTIPLVRVLLTAAGSGCFNRRVPKPSKDQASLPIPCTIP